jgi:glycosyltransferase involved in cell wall biosynthesis
LPDCLESLAPAVDEIVVVDTGSTDRSVAIAEGAGARVFRHSWDGSFSRARNTGLDRARGRWILYIDADERLRPVDRLRLEEFLQHTEHVGFRILLRPLVGWTPYREYRLWRNDPRIRFRGVMHEKIIPALSEVAKAEGSSIGDAWLQLDHLGYEGDQAPKHRRNLPLLRAELEADPGNVFNWHHLGRALDGVGATEEAEQALARAVELARLEDPPTVYGAAAWADFVRLRYRNGQPVESLLAEARARWPDNWLLLWIDAHIHLDAERFEVALSLFEQLPRVDVPGLPDAGLAYDSRLFGTFAQESIGLCLFRLGRYGEAADAYRVVERLEPENREFRVKRQLCEQAAARQAPPGSAQVQTAGRTL